MEEPGLLTSMAIVLGVALIGGMAARIMKLPVILGYLLSGVLIGPYGLKLISEVGDVETLAEIGVVLLMFTLGLEFSFTTLRRIGKVAVFGGTAQIVVTAALGLMVGQLLDWSLRGSVLFGFFIALSSTIIVLKTLMERGELGSPHGRVMIGILLVQDISVVPMMVILPSLDEVGFDLWISLGWAVLQAILFLGAIFAIGVWVLPWFMRRVAGGRSRELFLLTVVCLCLGAAFGAYHFGLSAALGAFIAGLLVSESEYAHQALADIRPLRDIFAILFFVSLGMLADLSFIAENPGEVAAVVVAIVLGKFVIAGLVARLFGYSAKTALFVGSGLFQIGEFSFVLAALALELEIISRDLYSLTLAAALITMLLTPFGMGLTSALYHRFIQTERGARLFASGLDPEVLDERKQLVNHAVICGYGRVAQNLGTVLERRGFSYLIIDLDPRVIDSAHERGIPHIYGDASNPEILARAELERAKVLVITFPDPIAAKLAVANARRINPRIDVVARVQRDEDSEALRKLGVAEMVRPELEAGLEIIRHTLHRFGLTMQEIQYIVNTLREEKV
ncbi:MAG TPA: sodium:proton exchanger [Dehalococcoidia bacterium]|nr:sodium:proton exchanger [Dehalococcoidia bacterium]